MPISVATRAERRGSAAARLPPGRWKSVVFAVCCQVEISATDRSFIQRNPAECGVSERDLETSTVGRPRPTGTVEPYKIEHCAIQ